MKQANGKTGDERCLPGGLGNDGMTGDEGRRDLANEDRQGEIPRTDADNRPSTRRRKPARGNLARVIVAKIHGLADLGNGVRAGLPRFTDAQTGQSRLVFLQKTRHLPQDFSTLFDINAKPYGRE